MIDDEEHHLTGKHLNPGQAGGRVPEAGQAVDQGVEVAAVGRREPEGFGQGRVQAGGVRQPAGVDPNDRGELPVSGFS
jgi:hypothetical protein